MTNSTSPNLFSVLNSFQDQSTSTTYSVLAKTVGDLMLACSLLGLSVSVLIAYPFHEAFGLGAQLFAHLGVLTFATLLKIGYVLRLIGHYELGLKMT